MSEIRFCLQTVEDFQRKKLKVEAADFFEFLENLIKIGHTVKFYRKPDDEPALSIIKDLDHLKNFENSFRVLAP